MTFPVRKFGVEIEFTGIHPDTAIEALRAAGVECYREDYNHQTRTYWKIIGDSSIRPPRGVPRDHCGELVSPPLSGEDGLAMLKRAAEALKSAGAKTNASCGLHVHVDGNDLTAGEILGVVERYAHFEETIDSFMPKHRRNNRYTQTLGGGFLNSLRSHVARNNNPYETFRRTDRYRKVNVVSYARHGTVEFRQHHGTVDFNKIQNWVKFCVNFVQRFRDNRAPDVVLPPPRPPVFPSYVARRRICEQFMHPRGANPRVIENDFDIDVSYFRPDGEIFEMFRSFGEFEPIVDSQVRWGLRVSNWDLFDEWVGAHVAPPDAPSNRNPILNVSLIPPGVGRNDTVFDGIPEDVARFFQGKLNRIAARRATRVVPDVSGAEPDVSRVVPGVYRLAGAAPAAAGVSNPPTAQWTAQQIQHDRGDHSTALNTPELTRDWTDAVARALRQTVAEAYVPANSPDPGGASFYPRNPSSPWWTTYGYTPPRVNYPPADQSWRVAFVGNDPEPAAAGDNSQTDPAPVQSTAEAPAAAASAVREEANVSVTQSDPAAAARAFFRLLNNYPPQEGTSNEFILNEFRRMITGI